MVAQRIISIQISTALITEECFKCGVLFAMPESLQKEYLRTGNAFYCPNGHPQCYTESTQKKLRRAEERLREQTAYSHRLSNQLDGTLRSLSATKGHLTRTKNRIHNGVCPCCRRHFDNLEQHMKGQHPEYQEEKQS